MDNHNSSSNESECGSSSTPVGNDITISLAERSCTKSDNAPAPTTRSSVWGVATATREGDPHKQSSNATLADIMMEQESEKNKHENSKSAKVKFSDDIESEEERMMRLAIEASLRDQQQDEMEEKKQLESVIKNSQASYSSSTAPFNGNDDMDEDIKMAIALSLGSTSLSNDAYKLDENDESLSDDRKPAAKQNTIAVTNDEDESEKLARALHDAEIKDYNSSQAAEEAASLALALQLQREEDTRHLNNVTIDNANRAAQLKREAMCRGDNVGITGIRTVDRDEFQRMQGAKAGKGYGGDRIADRRRDEERGMGKLLNTHYPEAGDTGPVSPDDADSYYYYSNDKHQEDEDDDHYYEEEYFGIKMNSQSASSSSWQRVDRDTFIGPNNEIKSKHDPELKHKSNAMNLLEGYGESTSVSDRAYNAFRRSEARQSGMKKGVLNQGHGRAENMNASKTRGGAMDGNVRLQIAAAVNMGLIDRCNGVVKEGKEGLVYHAESGKGRKSRDDSAQEQEMESDGHDVAVKVFKRISEFRNRKDYVDGDPRYKQMFKTNDAREQVVLWTEKEYRNLLRAWRGGISVPKPLYQNDNILFMRFLGEEGWPSPQLREIELKKGSSRWTTLYCQTLVAIRRLYHCARLVHGDLSEYNILICPKWQAMKGAYLSPGERSGDDEDLQVVLIDFGQAVDIRHARADEFLQRDLCAVTQFFANQGITTITARDAGEFVVESSNSDAEDLVNDTDCDFEEEEGSKRTGNWRNIAASWDEQRDTEELLARLK